MSPPSPRTPQHSRHPSHISISSPTPSPQPLSRSQRHSKSYMHTPQTPSQFDRSNSIDIDNPAGNGLGNLADELADAWSEGEEEEEEEDDDPDLDFHHGNDDGHETENDTGTIEASHRHEEEIRDSGIDVGNAESPGEKVAASGRQERNGTYDGTTGRDDSDLESRLPPALEARIDTLESFVRRGWEDGGSGNDGVVQRVVQDLRDLGGQSGVENAATRLITTHTALSTHLLHQTRLLHTLSHPLLSPLAPSLDPDTLDALLPLLEPLTLALPRANPQATTSLSSLHHLTNDLLQTLTQLADSLHMSRQTTTTASRRLRSARELVAEMRREVEAAEEGERWLRRGNWSEKLQRRECASQCAGVVGGFEEACGRLRGRLIEMAGEVGEVGA